MLMREKLNNSGRFGANGLGPFVSVCLQNGLITWDEMLLEPMCSIVSPSIDISKGLHIRSLAKPVRD